MIRGLASRFQWLTIEQLGERGPEIQFTSIINAVTLSLYDQSACQHSVVAGPVCKVSRPWIRVISSIKEELGFTQILMSTLTALSRFNSLASQGTDNTTQAVTKATHESFQLIEPWTYARSGHPEVQEILGKVRNEVKRYYNAVNGSLQTAQSGYSFAKDAEALCDFLMEPKGTYSAHEIREFIDDMRVIARKAHADANATAAMFRKNRQNFYMITKNIPTTLTRIDQEMEYQNRLISKRRDRIELYKTLELSFGAMSATMATGLAIAGAAFPPALLVLPILLPLATLAAGLVGRHYELRREDSETQVQTCVDAMDQLGRMTSDLEKLGSHIDKMADWWLGVDGILEDIRSRVEAIQGDYFARLRVKPIRDQWCEVSKRYLDYKTGIARLQDFYPSSIEN